MTQPRSISVSTMPSAIQSALSMYPELLQKLLYNRGILNQNDAQVFLNPDYNTHPHDPFLLTDMEKAAERVLLAIKKNEHIVIYSDYDCDGIPGGVLFHDFLIALQYKNFENYIPHRHYEGYGFTIPALQKFAERDARLIITIDCGITDNATVVKAQEFGIDVIVTDHHEPGEAIPPAYAVINPKRDTAYPFSGICGTTVVYKLVQAILALGKKEGMITLMDGWEKWLLDLVGIATIADMVPLVDENRVFAKYGIEVLRKSRRPGLHHLLRKAGCNQRFLTEIDIGFTIAPRINAASRMDNPEDAFHMLRTRDEKEAGMYVAHLEKLNNERKGVVAHMTQEAKQRMRQGGDVPEVIVMGSLEWRPSLVGLVAHILAEEFERPTFLWGCDGNGNIKGSCRSDGKVSVVHLMERTRGSFLTFGGHHASGGFSVEHDALYLLQDHLVEALERKDKDGEESNNYHVDSEINLDDITSEFMKTIELLGPYGIGNQQPLFVIRDVAPSNVLIFGKTKNHTKIYFETLQGVIEAISFFTLPNEFSVMPEKGKMSTLLVHVERSFFMGTSRIRLRILDIV